MTKHHRYFHPLAAGLLFALPARGADLHYGAALHEAEWQVSSSRLECRLAQEIPRYGQAAFARKAGGALEFYIRVRQRASQEAVAQLHSMPPAWGHDAIAVDLGKVNTVKGDTPLVLPESQARRLLSELEKGMSPTLTYWDWGDERDQVVVAVSAVNLRKSLPPFFDCLEHLLPNDFHAVSRSTLHFPLASKTIGPEDGQRLAAVAEYLVADEGVKSVRIAGHADSVGSRSFNWRLSRQRAEAARDFLVKQGISAERLRVEQYGESSPLASNRTAEGRARNRRVEVSLHQDPPGGK